MSHLAFIQGVPLFTSTTRAPCVTKVGKVVRQATVRSLSHRVPLIASLHNEGKNSPSISESDESSMQRAVETVVLTTTAALMGFSVSGLNTAEAIPEAIKEGFKSIPASLVHPVVMWLAVATTLYTFYLGYQSSQVRKVSPEKRKELVKGKFSDRHFKTSSSLFAVVTLITFGGMANTFSRTGKLFPGPHLYAGLGIVAVMSVMSALVPYMQKGKDWARNTHFTGAFVVTGLFLWQAKSGMVILGKLLNW